MRCYIVDAFSDTPFCGNPAAICVLEDFLEDTLMQKIAIEHNLSETAFIVKQDSGDCALRWFTPAKEIDLCRHATLASAFVVMNIIESHAKAVHFHTKSGILKVIKNGSLFEMDFPSFQLTPISVTQEMSEAIGYMPQKAYLGRDSVCILDENQVINATPDIAKVKHLQGELLHITSKGSKYDIVSRSFAPKHGVAEDPVCGSGHCHLVPLWSEILNRAKITAYQASKRGGVLYCEYQKERVKLAGKAYLYSINDIQNLSS
ncbi:PhzF family phenazine biosynthesis protein [uncultured Helicobacter sp.]|nr:PhzF family phenazine biosynthesis protein [uncultured Helicobacter sp.]